MPSKKIRKAEREKEQQIIDLLKANSQYPSDLFRALKAKKKRDIKIISHILNKLEKEKLVVQDKKGILKITSSKTYITGKISITSQGFGFVTQTDEDAEDIFIPAKHVNTAMDGDFVKVRIFDDSLSKKDSGKGPVGLVHDVVERHRPFIVGELLLKDNGFFVRPLNRKLPEDIKVDSCGNAKRGDWVKANVNYDSRGRDKTVCEIQKSLGKVGKLENDMQAIILEYGLIQPYSQAEEEKAIVIEPAKIKREDLTSLLCVTIDPHDAKDFDDSISISPGENENELIVGVHIADVAAWIQPNTRFDKEAFERGFTAYIPGNTLPMLPRQLTRKISLTTDDVNYAHTVLLTINKKNGRIISQRRVHSKIKISARLTFNEVEDYIQTGKVLETWNNDLAENISKLVETFHLMRGYRKELEKFLEISTTEIRILREDDTGEIVGLEKKKQGEADQLVEEFMLAANSAVARELTNSKIPGMYRIHPEPDEEKLNELSEFVGQVFKLSTGNLNSGREACQHFLEKISGKSYEEIIIGAFLRSMNRALYQEKPEIHFGLGKGLYSHFTSPIRRYPDLIVHQQLWLHDTKKELMSLEIMRKTAADSTAKEKNNDEAYYAANDRLKLHYLQKFLDSEDVQTYEGVIRILNASGVIADIPDIGISGFIPTKYLKKRKGKLVASRGSSNYKPGDFISLQLVHIDFIKGDAIFKPIQV